MSINRSKPDQYQLRFPPGLRDKLKSAADVRARSMNAEIVARLESSFAQPLDDEDARANKRRIDTLVDDQARTKDMVKEALNALARDDVKGATHILAPLAWYVPISSADDGEET